MKQPDLDPNQWYYVYAFGNNALALRSSKVYNDQGTTGVVALNYTQPNLDTMRWQFYPINSTTYVLRSKEGGPSAFIGTYYTPAEVLEGHTRPRMVRGDIADASVFWRLDSWEDDTFWLWNEQNSSSWHMNANEDFLMNMSNNLTLPQDGQRWNFTRITKIDDENYSSVVLPGLFVTSPDASALTTPTSSASSSTTPVTASSSTHPTSTSTLHDASSGLSTGGKIGLGVGLGVAGLIALLVLGFFLRRRRHARASAAGPQVLTNELYQGQPRGDAARPPRGEEQYKHELYEDGGASVHEMPNSGLMSQQGVAEVDARAQERPAELMGNVGRRG